MYIRYNVQEEKEKEDIEEEEEEEEGEEEEENPTLQIQFVSHSKFGAIKHMHIPCFFGV